MIRAILTEEGEMAVKSEKDAKIGNNRQKRKRAERGKPIVNVAQKYAIRKYTEIRA